MTVIATVFLPRFIYIYRMFEFKPCGTQRGGFSAGSLSNNRMAGIAILPATHENSAVHEKNIPTTCKKCHQGVYDDYLISSHGQLWVEGKKDAPVCTTCHEEHGVESLDSNRFKQQTTGQCGTCHEDQISTYGDTFHGKATSLGYMIAADCADCHTAHKIFPSDDVRSTVHKDNLLQTCSVCHEGANVNFTEFRPHLDLHGAIDVPYIRYVALFMKWLLISVFLFWGLHTFLWFQRSVVALLRKEFKHPPSHGKHILRFSSKHRMTHMIMVITFIGLVATGVPMKYYYADWSHTLQALFGGLEVSRYLHRVFAILTLGYFTMHIASLLRRFLAKREPGMLSGPNSMMPRWKDFHDFFANIKWFFYQAPILTAWSRK